jgi:hypothetical protein
MQTFLKILGFVTIFIGIILGIYVISDSLKDFAIAQATNNSVLQQVYIVKLIAGGAIIMSSILSGIFYLSFGVVIELLDSINQKLSGFELKRKEESE